MHPKVISCPTCGQPEMVEKVSTLYVLGIERREAAKETGGRPALLDQLSPGELRALGRRLSPPSSAKQPFTRPVHPDLVVVAFSLLLPVFLYGIFTSQAGGALVALLALALFYGLYFWQRKRIVQRFAAQQQVRKSQDERVRRAIQRWMNLYYCLEDDGVFLPGDAQVTPADQMMGRLMG